MLTVNMILFYCVIMYALLSRAISLERFVNCLDEIRLFLHDNKTEFKELYNIEWLAKLMFFTDLTRGGPSGGGLGGQLTHRFFSR